VAGRSFDPEREAVLEEDPGIDPAPGLTRGTAIYEAVGTDGARVTVTAPAAGLVVIRNGYDPHWSATVDGEPAEVLPANHFLQAVAVPRGQHVIELRYADPLVRAGLLGSAASLAALGVAAALARWRERRGRRAADASARTAAAVAPDGRAERAEARARDVKSWTMGAMRRSEER
jgi:hypothetical protein